MASESSHLKTSSALLQDLLFDWLESSVDISVHIDSRHVAQLFGELIRRDVFSYHQYMQRLISRCEVLGLDEVDAFVVNRLILPSHISSL